MNASLAMAAAFGALIQVALPAPYAAWKYQRTITPAASAGLAEQCVVLDAQTFTRAAPGLRDLRLLQDGREVAYALDESHDEAFDRSADAQSNGHQADRALYETSLIIPALPSNWPGPRPSVLHPAEHPPGSFYGKGELPARVPVERIRLMPGPVADETLGLAAWQQTDIKQREELDTVLTPQHPVADFTIGANLQTAAGVGVSVSGTMPQIQAVLLEMRRRELCFQPLSSSPLQLLLGSDEARPVHYDYPSHFHPSATPLLAAMGPVDLNPAYREHVPRHVTWLSLRQAKILAQGCAIVFALWITLSIYRRK